MTYTIQDIANMTGLTPRAIRHYEAVGLIHPTRTTSNYRQFTETDLDRLQLILFYKRTGMPLSHIKRILEQGSSTLSLLEQQLDSLRKEQEHIGVLIETVERSIQHTKGDRKMNDNEKFHGLKEEMISKNDTMYKDEVVQTYGEERYEQSVQSFRKMSPREFEEFQTLEQDIITLLLESNLDPASEAAQQAARYHQRWISLAWGRYDKHAHLGLVDLYLADPRFQSYYDKHRTGLASTLRDAVHRYLNQ
jgi:DNA-binding transcriptional MerR regulator